uniref:Protein RMD5 homolog B n=1 Tax=Schistocephalus solidus TaxID=70667 RepID=A0A0X3PD66_SCHSO
MGSKNGTSDREKLSKLSREAINIEERLDIFKDPFIVKYTEILSELQSLNAELGGRAADEALPENERKRLRVLLDRVKAFYADAIKKHREVHTSISKFGVSVSKTFVEDLSNVASYINMGSIRSMSDSSVDPAPESLLYKSADNMSREELFATIIIEDLIRNGYGPVAIQLAREVGLSEEDIGFKHFCEIGEMVAALRFGKLEPAKSWLAKHCDSLGVKARQLEYVLAKLDFLMRVQQCVDKPTAVLEYMRSFVPYAKEFPADFEHVMGSLVFLGHSLKGTPYADLALNIPSCSANSDRHHSASSGETQQREGNEERSSAMSDPSAGGVALPLLPLVGLSTGQMDWCHQPSQQEGDEEAVAAAEEEEEDNDTPNAFVRAAHLFGTVACAQLGLSSIDPLRTAFASGLRVLPKLQSLQRAIAWLTKYSSSDSSNTLPVPVELESIAQRHNIFHCPVIKEVANMTNTPVRLTCGHAISRDAFNSLASSDRRKVKCPYCPMETYKNQVMDLIF